MLGISGLMEVCVIREGKVNVLELLLGKDFPDVGEDDDRLP